MSALGTKETKAGRANAALGRDRAAPSRARRSGKEDLGRVTRLVSQDARDRARRGNPGSKIPQVFSNHSEAAKLLCAQNYGTVSSL